MEFSLNCVRVNPVFSQAIKTCDIKATDSDSAFLFSVFEEQLWVTSLNRFAEQTILVPTKTLEASENESFFVSGQSIVELLRQFPDDEALCKYDGSILTIMGTLKDITIELPTGKSDDFASFNYHSITSPVECDAARFSNALRSTAFSASSDSDDGALTGVHVAILNDKLIAESSDNQRISVFTIDNGDTGDECIDFVLPKEVADILGNSLSDIDTVQIDKGRNHIRFHWGETTFISRLISDADEKFPNLSDFIDCKVVASIDVSRGELLKRLKLIALLVKDSLVTIKCNSEGLRIIANEKDRGSSSNLIEPQTVEGKAETMVPYKYLLKAVDMMDFAWITLQFTEVPYLETTASESGLCLVDRSYKHFIFPVREKDQSDEEE